MVHYLRRPTLDKVAFWLFSIGGFAFSVTFLISGYASVPRRWAQHLPEWVAYSESASVVGALVAIGATIFALRFLASLGQARTA